ncbi:hypothetical protein F3087_19835 [Nocardia colli]|uniref:HEAT repeat domain-containing protein n=1 Tax=Nocardia colli TaxID=2545717 RepID=A0A5N0ECI2_9NOCA|nr:hypothetical protein [Nocardia colli]KAA8887157.1 hypothetical protein F3087_19835 [Nocardia colli]
MSNDARRAAVVALTELARSTDVRDRADAGHGLAAFAEMTDARAILASLVLDEDDTFVTAVTAEALLRRKDAAGLSIVAAAFAVADATQSEWIGTALQDVYGVFAAERDAAVRICTTLTRDPDPRIRSGATDLITELNRIEPILHPA